MAVIEKERTARKPYRCERCTGRIAPGMRYLDSRLPPQDDVNTSDHWWCIKVHVSIDVCYPPPEVPLVTTETEGP
jgi:hypothetical protein